MGMTTDETRDQGGSIPGNVIRAVLVDQARLAEMADRVVDALLAAGLLAASAPTDERVERALSAHEAHAGCRGDEFREYVCPECGHLYATVEDRKAGLDADALSEAVHRHRMTRALAAAGVAPPECKDCGGFGRVGDGPDALGIECPECGGAGVAPPAPSEPARHEFLPVNGHPDDDECTYRDDGTDATYCGEPREFHNADYQEWLEGERSVSDAMHYVANPGSEEHPAQSADRERQALNRVWAAMGCAWNPEEFRPSVRDSMWKQIIEWCEEQTAGNTRIYRENQQLQSAVLAARAPVDEARLPTETRDRLRAFLELSLEGRYEYTARVGDREGRIGADDLRVLLDSLRGDHGISQD